MRGLADLSLSFCGIVDRGKGCVTSTNLQFDNRTSAVKVWHPPCTAVSIWSAVLPALFMVCGRGRHSPEWRFAGRQSGDCRSRGEERA